MATISFSTTFNLTAPTALFNLFDTTNYVAQGIDPDAVTGSFQITSPSGEVIYDNLSNYNSATLADIIRADSTENQIPIQIPTDLEQGAYSIYYKIWVDGIDETFNVTEVFNFIYASPTVEIAGSVQVYTPSPLLTEYDNTVYIVNSVTPTIDRTATITYPPVMVNNVLSTPTATVGTTATTSSSTFYSPTQVTMSVVSDLEYSFTGTGSYTSFTVLDTVSDAIQFDIDATSYCSLYCGLHNYFLRVTANPQDANLKDTFSYMMGLVTLIQLAQNCGNTTAITTLVAEIEAVGNFTEECDCSGEVTQVVGLGSLVNAYNVLGANSYITVTPVTSGNTTTFTIQLSTEFIATVVALGVDITTINSSLDTIRTDITTLQQQVDASLSPLINVVSSDNSTTVVLTASATDAVVVNSGTGWAVNDTFTVLGGTGTATVITVDSVSSGAIRTWHVSTAGSYTVVPSNPVSGTASGSGLSATFDLQWNKSFNLKEKSWQPLSFATSTTNYVECAATVAYPALPNAQFVFSGTDNVGTGAITKILANVCLTNASGLLLKIKVRDLTNSLDIAEYSTGSISASTSQILDLGVVSNLPASSAVFGIYVLTGSAAGANTAKLFSLNLGKY